MKKHILTFLLALLVACSPQAQDKKAAKFAKVITAEDLRTNLTFLASDSLRGRDTGSPEQKIAANFIAKHFENLGLTAIAPQPDGSKSYFQNFPLLRKKLPNGRTRMMPAAGKVEGADTVWTANVLGFMEGTDKKEEVLVITAHYDHVGMGNNGQIHNGADDDGSGTVSVMEIAKAFADAKKHGNGPRRSILFMTVTGEEKGLLGSAHYTTNPVLPLENTIADLNIDMVGRTDKEHEGKGDYVYIIGSDKLSSELHAINEESNNNNTKMELDYKYNDPEDPNRFYYRSDHYNFAKYKIPVVFYFNGVHDDYHQPTDDVEKIQFDKMEKRAKLVFYTAWALANRDKRISVDSNKP